MIKFIILCTVIALCMARSLNEDVPNAVINSDDVASESNTSELKNQKVDAPELPNQSDSAAEIDSNSADIVDSDKLRFGLFRFTTTTGTTTTTPTTTPLPMMQSVNLLITLNSIAQAGN